ncbi:class II aldolase/adducin family protein [Cellulomonas sp. P5_E12]
MLQSHRAARATPQVRDEILYYCRESVRAGLNFNTQGNISVRLSDEAIVITPSGVRYDLMTPDDLLVVDLDGNVLSGSLLPSTELPVHLAHYRRRPEVRAIVHTESTFVNVLGVLGRTIDPVLLNMVLYAKGPVPVMPFEFSTHAEFGGRSAELMGDDVNAVVWANHGLLAVGTTLELAFKVAVAVEENAEVLHHASLAGVPNVLVYDRIVVPEGARLP